MHLTRQSGNVLLGIIVMLVVGSSAGAIIANNNANDIAQQTHASQIEQMQATAAQWGWPVSDVKYVVGISPLSEDEITGTITVGDCPMQISALPSNPTNITATVSRLADNAQGYSSSSYNISSPAFSSVANQIRTHRHSC